MFTTNVLLLAPLLLLTRRWRTPLGTATTLFTAIALLTGAMDEYAVPLLVVAALLAGVGTDLLRVLRPAPERPAATWALGVLVPLVVWSLWFAAQAASGGLARSAEMWTGTVLWSAVFGGVLAGVVAPPAGASAAAPVPASVLPSPRVPEAGRARAAD